MLCGLSANDEQATKHYLIEFFLIASVDNEILLAKYRSTVTLSGA